MKRLNLSINLIALLISVFVMFFVFMLNAPRVSAADKELDTLKGELDVTFSSTTGKLTASYDGDQELTSGALYTWYKDGSTVSNSKEYMPTTAGSYYCTLKDTNLYEGTITSNTATIYRATGNKLSFDNENGLYEVGDTVTVSADLGEGEVVTNWKTNANGVRIPQNGSTVSFKMPSQNVTITATIKKEVSITMYGGTADKYTACAGDVVTITASSVSGKEFVSWTASGGKIADQKAKVTTITVANSNIVITANFAGETTASEQNGNDGKANAVNAVYKILSDGGNGAIQVYHHSQGPLCDAAFKYAQGKDWLVTDYFNITVNNSLTTYETQSPVKIQITIPDDLIQPDRHWRMVCISRDGKPYSFEDEDNNDSTITFTTNRFYAFAMCYNDIQPSTEEVVEENVPEASASTVPTTAPQSEVHSANESQTSASTIHSADASATMNVSGVATAAATNGAQIKSDQKSAVEQANGAQVSLISM